MGKWSGLRIAGAIFFGLVLFMIGLGWFVIRGRDREFERLQARIQQSGGRIYRSSKADPWLVTLRRWTWSEAVDGIVGYEGNSIIVEKPDATKDQLDDLLTARPIRQVNAEGVKNLDDSWLAGIRDPLAMRCLKLGGTGVTDRSVETILEMKGLEELYLEKTAISDDAVHRLRLLPRLKTLLVEGPNIMAVRLLDLKFVDAEGRTAAISGGTLRAIGRVVIEGLTGTPSGVGVTVTLDPQDSPEFVWLSESRRSQCELGDLVEESSGVWSFQIDVPEIPAGKSSVDVMVITRSANRTMTVFYGMKAASLRLAQPPNDEAAPSPAP
jgi:hypothetical protein